MAPQRTSKAEQGPDKGECDECGKYFARDLRRHKRSHLAQGIMKCPFEYCEDRFNQKQNMDVHINKWHNGTRPYRCPHYWVDEHGAVAPCAARFDDRAVLSRHRKTQHGHTPHAKDAVAEIRLRGREKQEKDCRRYEVELAERAVTRATERWRDVPGGADALVLPPQVQVAAPAVVAPSSSPLSAGPSSAPAGSSRSSPASRASGSSSSTSGHAQSSDTSSQHSLHSSQESFAAVPGATGTRQPTSRNGGSSSSADQAPYNLTRVGNPLTYGNTAHQYPPMSSYPVVQPQNISGYPNASLHNQTSNRFPAMPPYNPYAVPSTMHGNVNYAVPFASFPDSMFDSGMGMGFDTSMNAGMNMGMSMGVPDMLPPYNMPFVGHHQPQHPSASGSQGWSMPGYSRESSPSGSSTSSATPSPQMRRRRGEAQDAFAFRYMQ